MGETRKSTRKCLGPISALGPILLSIACATPGASGPSVSSYLRGATAAQTGCAQSEVQISEHGQTLGNETWLATCRGVAFQCTRVATGYGTGLTCVKSREQPATPAAPVAPTVAPAAVSAPAIAETAGTLELRLALDRERDAILACGGWRVVGLKVETRSDHTLEVQLTGDLAGSPQEACVRQLLAPARPSNVPPGTAVIHVVR